MLVCLAAQPRCREDHHQDENLRIPARHDLVLKESWNRSNQKGTANETASQFHSHSIGGRDDSEQFGYFLLEYAQNYSSKFISWTWKGSNHKLDLTVVWGSVGQTLGADGYGAFAAQLIEACLGLRGAEGDDCHYRQALVLLGSFRLKFLHVFTSCSLVLCFIHRVIAGWTLIQSYLCFHMFPTKSTASISVLPALRGVLRHTPQRHFHIGCDKWKLSCYPWRSDRARGEAAML